MTRGVVRGDMRAIIDGFMILAGYDNFGDVQVSRDRAVVAGPHVHDVNEISLQDRTVLQLLGWELDDTVRRWCYRT